MKTTLTLLLFTLFVSGCSDRVAAEQRAKEEAEAKARAEAARKEMDALPKAFKSEPFFKRNTPVNSGTAPAPTQTPKAQTKEK